MFSFDDEHRKLLTHIIKPAGVTPLEEAVAALELRIIGSYSAYLSETQTLPLAVRRQKLLSLLQLIEDPDPPIAQIRLHVAELPPEVLADLNVRARSLDNGQLEHPMPPDGIATWAKSAKPDELVQFIRACIVERITYTGGRKRPGGKRSAARLQPVILGGAPGIHKPTADRQLFPIKDNGRPTRDPQLRLIIFLAIDWLHVIGSVPEPGRSGTTPFGDLVHSVFSWLKIKGKAESALRLYWELVEAGRNKTDPPLTEF